MATNTFVAPNGELGFSLREMKEITGLPILGEIYEEYFPITSEIELESEEFRHCSFSYWPLLNIPKVAGIVLSQQNGMESGIRERKEIHPSSRVRVFILRLGKKGQRR